MLGETEKTKAIMSRVVCTYPAKGFATNWTFHTHIQLTSTYIILTNISFLLTTQDKALLVALLNYYQFLLLSRSISTT